MPSLSPPYSPGGSPKWPDGRAAPAAALPRRLPRLPAAPAPQRPASRPAPPPPAESPLPRPVHWRHVAGLLGVAGLSYARLAPLNVAAPTAYFLARATALVAEPWLLRGRAITPIWDDALAGLLGIGAAAALGAASPGVLLLPLWLLGACAAGATLAWALALRAPLPPDVLEGDRGRPVVGWSWLLGAGQLLLSLVPAWHFRGSASLGALSLGLLVGTVHLRSYAARQQFEVAPAQAGRQAALLFLDGLALLTQAAACVYLA